MIASWRQNLRWDASSPLTVSSQPYRQPHWGSPRDFRLGILHLVCFPIQQQHLKTPLMQSMRHTSQFECVSLKGIHEFILLSHCPPVSILTCSDSLLQKYRNFLFFTDLLFLLLIKDSFFHTKKMYLCYLNTNIINYDCLFFRLLPPNNLCIIHMSSYVLTCCKWCGVTQINTFL